MYIHVCVCTCVCVDVCVVSSPRGNFLTARVLTILGHTESGRRLGPVSLSTVKPLLNPTCRRERLDGCRLGFTSPPPDPSGPDTRVTGTHKC